ncbi:hypothetical protein [Natronococcus occultus]|uniref:hypothetical protein n=1 Tax=Natronococcus occultus TaxID=29288 RepID=UPI000677D4A9|nr:hypothetical protein [Natronococcus occultus]
MRGTYRCSSCGAQFKATRRQCGVCGTSGVETTRDTCRGCGTTFEDSSSQRCPRCGSDDAERVA